MSKELSFQCSDILTKAITITITTTKTTLISITTTKKTPPSLCLHLIPLWDDLMSKGWKVNCRKKDIMISIMFSESL